MIETKILKMMKEHLKIDIGINNGGEFEVSLYFKDEEICSDTVPLSIFQQD